MIRTLLAMLMIGFFVKTNAQIIANDSVSLNAGNTEMVYYNLATGQKTTTSNTDWHIAVTARASQFPSAPLGGTTIRINEANGVHVYYVPNASAATFNAVDTTGFASWSQLHDSDTAMDEGALNSNRNKANFFDFGWGVYNQSSHNVVGDSVYVFTLPGGGVKKLLVESLVYDTAFIITYTDIDNSNPQTLHIRKADYPGKNFVYVNMLTNQVLDKEPANNTWDIQFLKYAALDVLPDSAYPVVGVWSNKSANIARRTGVESTSNDNTGLSYSRRLNTIGWNWKYYDFQNNAYQVEDSLSYFIQTYGGLEYKLVFTGYTGSSTGVISFYKEALNATAINELPATGLTSVYPNPVSDLLQVNFNTAAQRQMEVVDLSGRLVYQSTTNQQTAQIPVADMPAGVYLLAVKQNGTAPAISKFIVAK
ncbi:MAG: T9SS type A sorting domain-containing protein [Chitinophagales bacterium]